MQYKLFFIAWTIRAGVRVAYICFYYKCEKAPYMPHLPQVVQTLEVLHIHSAFPSSEWIMDWFDDFTDILLPHALNSLSVLICCWMTATLSYSLLGIVVQCWHLHFCVYYCQYVQQTEPVGTSIQLVDDINVQLKGLVVGSVLASLDYQQFVSGYGDSMWFQVVKSHWSFAPMSTSRLL